MLRRLALARRPAAAPGRMTARLLCSDPRKDGDAPRKDDDVPREWLPPGVAAEGEQWVPPAAQRDAAAAARELPVRPGEPLSPAEVRQLCEGLLGEDVTVVELAGKTDLADALVLVSGRSTAHLRRMGDALVRALQDRDVPGISPVLVGREDPDAEWLVVDGLAVVVHLLLPEYRRLLDLEGLWAADGLAGAGGAAPRGDWDESVEELRRRHPAPEELLARNLGD